MAEENNNDTPETGSDQVTQPEPVAAEPAESGKRFTQDDLDRTVEKRLAREKRAHEKELAELRAQLEKASAKAPKPSEPTPTPNATDDLSRKFDELTAKLRKQENDQLFNETIMDANLTLTRDQRSLLRDRFDPDEPDAVIDLAKSVFAVSAAAAPKPAADAEPAPSQAPSVARQKPPEAPAPAGNPDADLPADLSRLKGDQLERLKSNPERFREYLANARERMGGGKSPLPFARSSQKG